MSRMRNAFVLILCLCATLSVARAQPAKSNDGFEPVNLPANMAGTAGEGIPAAPLVATAYGFIWVAVLVFVGSVALRTRRLERQIAEMEAQLLSRPRS